MTCVQERRIVFVLKSKCAEQFIYVPNMQEQSKTGKKSEINRQTFVICWLDSRRIDLSDIYLVVQGKSFLLRSKIEMSI